MPSNEALTDALRDALWDMPGAFCGNVWDEDERAFDQDRVRFDGVIDLAKLVEAAEDVGA